MNNEFEPPIYPGVGIPEPIRIPSGPMSIEKASEVLRTDADGIMKLIAEGRLHRYDAGRPLAGVTLVRGEEVYQLLLARQ